MKLRKQWEAVGASVIKIYPAGVCIETELQACQGNRRTRREFILMPAEVAMEILACVKAMDVAPRRSAGPESGPKQARARGNDSA
jgi:hypothetical protein